MNIIALIQNDENRSALHHALLEVGAAHAFQLMEGGIDKLGVIYEQFKPDLLIFDCNQLSSSDSGELETFFHSYPNACTIMLCRDPEPQMLINAMRMGVMDVLSYPINTDALSVAIARLEQRQAQKHGSRPKGRVLAFISCKGGSGATFLATNLGYVLSKTYEKQVLLVDLNLQFGEAFLYVSDAIPKFTLADIAKNIHRLDLSLLRSCLVQVSAGYEILAAPEDPQAASSIRPELMEKLINLARGNYDFVILDVGRNLNPATVKALDMSDQVFPVLQETLPFIRDANRMNAAFNSLGYSQEKVRFIVNRHEKDVAVSIPEIEETLKKPVFWAIPNSFKAVTHSVNHGTPVIEVSHHDAVSKSLTEFGKYLVDGGQPEWKMGWLSRLLHHA